MRVTAETLRRMSKGTPKPSLSASIVATLNEYGARYGLDQSHRLAHFLAQIAHESGGFKFDREIWGPTSAQKRYEGRKDLGNTQKGDGSKFRGYGPMQVTGRANVTAFYNWCKSEGLNPPDFAAKPELIASEKWAGLSAIWYWQKGNPTGKSLNVLADRNDIETITRRINGGLNGFADRLDYYDRAALVLLDYPVNGIRAFQEAAKKRGDYKRDIDGITGPGTRTAFHKALLGQTSKAEQSNSVAVAPVTEEKAVAVTPPALKEPWWKSKEVVSTALTGGGVSTAITSLGGWQWQSLLVVVVALFLGLIGFLIWSRLSDRKATEKQVQQIEGSAAKIAT